MIKRSISKIITKQLHYFPIISLTGPRQSGKTTLVKELFPQAAYVNLEEPDTRQFAIQDPRGFLDTYTQEDSKILIVDEAQCVPELFSYIQVRVDTDKKMGRYILTGSQNFLMDEHISQSLAGRVYQAKLLPFDLEELHRNKYAFPDIDSQIYHGFYPRLYGSKLQPEDWYPSYIGTYIERDVRAIKQIIHLNTFQRFIRICAARTGQIINLSSMGTDIGVPHTTIQSWLSVLEKSYIIFLLEPYFENYNKRVIKAPKLHFFDTGLACQLLGIHNKNELTNHYLRGALFESFVVSNIVKSFYHSGKEPKDSVYYWRDKTGHEVDCMVKSGNKFIPMEIKIGKTIHEEDFRNLNYWNKLSGNATNNTYVVYGGEEEQKRSRGNVIGWKFRAKWDNLPV